MDESTVFCTAADEASACTKEAEMIYPVPLCKGHQVQVAQLVMHDLLASAARNELAPGQPRALATEETLAVAAGARRVEIHHYMSGPHSPMVYFIENGASVKIGFSTHLRKRVSDLSLRDKNVMLLLRGGLTLERALHTRYAAYRIDNTEWFELSDEIREYVAAKSDQPADSFVSLASLQQEIVALRTQVDQHECPEPAPAPPDGQDEVGDSLPALIPTAVPVEPEWPRAKYPDEQEIETKHLACWETLATFGDNGATVAELSVTARRAGHAYCSLAWVRNLCAEWRAAGYVVVEQQGRDFRYWRDDELLRRKFKAEREAAS